MKKFTFVAALLVSPMIASANMNIPWCGFYMGLNAGAAINNDRTLYDYSYGISSPFAVAFGNKADNGGGAAGPFNINGLNAVDSAIAQGAIVTELGSSHKTVFTGGGQLGLNFQRGNFLIGLEADIDWMGSNSKAEFTGSATNNTQTQTIITHMTAESKVNWLSTERLRIGFPVGEILPYLTGGFAFGRTNASSSITGVAGNAQGNFSGSTSEIRTGWTAGGGLELMIVDGLSVRAEGLYYDLGTANYNLAPVDNVAMISGFSVNARHKFDGTMVRLGFNYNFNT